MTGVNLVESNINIDIGDNQTLNAQVSPINATNKTVTYTSDDTSVATVNATTGEVTGIAAGTCTITVTTQDQSLTDTCDVVVSVPVVNVTGVSLSQTSITQNPGDSDNLSVTVAPADATDQTVSWSSSDTGIATVSDSGLVTAVSVGVANITVTTTDGSFTDVCQVTVQPVTVTGVNIIELAMALDKGATKSATYQITPSDATDKGVTWSSSNTAVATVNSSGVVTGVSPGSATVTITTDDGGLTDTISVTVNPIAVTGLSITETTMTGSVGGSLNLTAIITPSDATNKTVHWSSSDNTTASVNGNGQVSTVKQGEVTITATSEEGGHKDTLKIYVLQTRADVEMKKIIIRDNDQNGYIDEVFFDTDRDLIAFDYFKPVFFNNIGTLDYDLPNMELKSKDVVAMINENTYGTGIVGDISIPKHLIIYKDYEGSWAGTYTVVDEAVPIVKAYSQTYHATYNNSATLKVAFSEDVTYNTESDKGARVQTGDGTISLPPESSGDHYTLGLSGFVENDEIEVRHYNRDAAGNDAVDTTFRLTDDGGGNLYWVQLP